MTHLYLVTRMAGYGISSLLIKSCIIPLILLFSLDSFEGKRILLLPFSFFSHVRQLSIIGDGLVDEGHEVYMVLAESFPQKDHFSKGKIKLIFSKSTEKDMHMWSANEWKEFIVISMSDKDTAKTWRRNYPAVNAMCTNPLSDGQLHATLKGLNFDLALVTIFPMSRCLLTIPYNLGIPYVGLTTCQEPWVWRNLVPPSAYPNNFRGLMYSDEMSFLERADNLWKSFDWAAFTGIEFLSDSYISKFIKSKEIITLNQMAAQCLLFLFDVDPLLDYPRPTMPNEIQIGGLSTKPPKPLPNGVKVFLDAQKKGVIVMTFGSGYFGMPPHHLKEFLEAFRQIKLAVLWKYNETISDLPPNVKVYDWLPQNDILSHSNVKIFITHCGNNGQMEALYNGVPMIGFPIFGDQPYNCKRLDAHKFGICLEPESFTAQDLTNAVNEILSDNIYKKNILRASNLFKDRPMRPVETAVYWINHVMKYGGEHLHAHALDMPWYEFLMLDILACMVGCIIIAFFITCCTAFKVYYVVFGKKQHLKKA